MALYDPDTYAALLSSPTQPEPPLGERVLLAALADPQPRADRLGMEARQVLNLAKLGLYLRGLPADYERFAMRVFYDAPGAIVSRPEFTRAGAYGHPCGTVACAVGHGPAAGVPPRDYVESWACYGAWAFTEDDLQFDFLFSGDWQWSDDTPRGAAARIALLLDSADSDFVFALMSGDSEQCDSQRRMQWCQTALPLYQPYLA